MWADVTAPASEHGLAPLSGSSPNVGVVGYFLGGGVSLGLARAFGVAANSVLAFELVTADGRLRRVDADHDADLFWALRGGGGSFGIVTAIEFTLYAVPELYGGAMMWPCRPRPRDARAPGSRSRAPRPDAFTSTVRLMHVPDLPEIPELVRGRQLVVIDGVFVGPADEGAALTAPFRALEPGGRRLRPAAARGPELRAHGPRGADGGLLGQSAARRRDRRDHRSDPGGRGAAARHAVGRRRAPPPRRRHGAAARGRGRRRRVSTRRIWPSRSGRRSHPALTAAVEAHLALFRDALRPEDSGREYLNFAERSRDASAFFGAGDLARLRAVKAEVDPEGMILANHPV